MRVGIIVLFFGIAFLLKYAADNSLLPIEFRLAGVALAATVLIGLGWRIGERRGAYGLILQGGGVGALYLTVFAATRLYHLLPAGAALPLMIAICGLSAFLAVRQNASSLAFMGSAGGFLAPVLLVDGRRQSRDAVQLLRAAQRGHLRDRVVQGVAACSICSASCSRFRSAPRGA